MPVIDSLDFENGLSAAAQGFYDIGANPLELETANTYGIGSAWGIRGAASLPADERFYASAWRALSTPIIGAGQPFDVEFDLDYADWLSTEDYGTGGIGIALAAGTVGSNNVFVSIDHGANGDYVDPPWSLPDRGYGIIITALGNDYAATSAPNLYDVGTVRRLKICGVLSTDSSTADGTLQFYVDGVLIFDFQNVALDNELYEIRLTPIGRCDNLVIGNTGCSLPPVTIDDDADICCADGDPDVVQAGGGQGAGASPVQTPSIGGSPIGCAGGGTVPTQADLTHSETWWGNS